MISLYGFFCLIHTVLILDNAISNQVVDNHNLLQKFKFDLHIFTFNKNKAITII